MKRWGALLIVMGILSFILPAIGMQFRLINLAGGDPSSSGVLFIIVGGVLFFIGQARERMASPTPRPAAAARPPQAAPPARPVQAPPPAAGTGGHTFCGSCGTRLTGPVKFCTSCGAAIQ
jgi:hypothetical protein